MDSCGPAQHRAADHLRIERQDHPGYRLATVFLFEEQQFVELGLGQAGDQCDIVANPLNASNHAELGPEGKIAGAPRRFAQPLAYILSQCAHFELTSL